MVQEIGGLKERILRFLETLAESHFTQLSKCVAQPIPKSNDYIFDKVFQSAKNLANRTFPTLKNTGQTLTNPTCKGAYCLLEGLIQL